MNKTILLCILSFIIFSTHAQENDSLQIGSFLMAGPIQVKKPLFSQVEDIKGHVFKDEDLLKNTYLPDLNLRPEAGDIIEWHDLDVLKWKKHQADKKSILKINPSDGEDQLAYIAFYIQNSEWADLKMTLTSAQMFEVYVDGHKKNGKYSWQKDGEAKAQNIRFDLPANNHIVIIKTLYSKGKTKNWTISCNISKENKNNSYLLSDHLNPELFMDIDHLMNGVDIQSAKLSALGDYYFVRYKMTSEGGKSQVVTDVKRLVDHQTVQLFHGSEVSLLKWAPLGNKLSYTTTLDGKTWLWEYNLDNGTRFPIAHDLTHLVGYTWSPDGEYLILTSSENAKKNTTGLKKIEGMPDHWPWYRKRTNLIILDYLSGVQTPLTHGYLSNNLQDISYNGRYILFSQNTYEYSQRPYGRQILLQYDRLSSVVDTIWDKWGSGSVQYSPDANQLLVTASPSFFGDIGTHLSKDSIPNDYDMQAYIYHLSNAQITPISKKFKPSIKNAYWSPYQTDMIYFTAADRTYVSAYSYSLKSQSYAKLDLGVDVINATDFSMHKPIMIYYGSSISTPKRLMMANLDTKEHYLVDYPEAHFFKNVTFGKTEDWNFFNKDSVIIEGRLYYPPHFDANKKYPMIVYYYGGTSPTERNFRGRYPKNLFAANGYMVYVLQPSGATGYGQDFSAEHVNNWGKTVAQEIVQGSRKLCQTHSFIDSTKVGCMGASYGGFMTMYLITQTDFFSAAIAHAGISSISSYWGQGYWGYLYSEVASANSFPWNNKDLYVNQSPLFLADRVHTPILLLHGNSDTNVPTGESRQFYAALKLLNKDVELIEIDKQDHHIVDYKKRIIWQETILAWFDKSLKKQPDWWFHLYPKMKL